MRVHRQIESWLQVRSAALALRQSIGFVPTMGALHDGHLALLNNARRENELVLLSIFLNPTQFDQESDLQHYPVTLERDLELAKSAGCDHVLLPTEAMMYPDHYRYRVSEIQDSRLMEGAHRPNHFDGVLTVVLKLLHISGCQKAYFGEKDFQQLELVRHMVSAFFLPAQIIACPTVREPDGLAMSSRNVHLSPEERKIAPGFYRELRSQTDLNTVRANLEALGFVIDYVEDRFVESTQEWRRFGAVKLGPVRLIDNFKFENRSS